MSEDKGRTLYTIERCWRIQPGTGGRRCWLELGHDGEHEFDFDAAGGLLLARQDREAKAGTRRTGPDPEDREPIGDHGGRPSPIAYQVPSDDDYEGREVRVTAKSGAVKADGGKRRVDLLPVRPILDIADVLTFGATKYADRNWQKGFPYGRVYAAALRHLFAWWNGEDRDAETNYSHLAHAATCIMFLLEYEHSGAGEDDRPKDVHEVRRSPSQPVE